jgi:hypothetical protein
VELGDVMANGLGVGCGVVAGIFTTKAQRH